MKRFNTMIFRRNVQNTGYLRHVKYFCNLFSFYFSHLRCIRGDYLLAPVALVHNGWSIRRFINVCKFEIPHVFTFVFYRECDSCRSNFFFATFTMTWVALTLRSVFVLIALLILIMYTSSDIMALLSSFEIWNSSCFKPASCFNLATGETAQ